MLVLNDTTLDADDEIVHLLGDGTNLSAGDDVVGFLEDKFRDWADGSSSTSAEDFSEFAVVNALADVLDGELLLLDWNTFRLAELDDRVTGDTWKDGTSEWAGVDCSLLNEEDVHGTNFLNLGVCWGVEPEEL